MSKFKDFISLVGATAFACNRLVDLAVAVIDLVSNYPQPTHHFHEQI